MVRSSVPTENSKSSLGTHLVTRQPDQYVGPTPLRFTCPLNDAPTAGPVEPRVHRASNVSGENSPIRVTSLTSAHTFSGGASMWSDTSPPGSRNRFTTQSSRIGPPLVELVETTRNVGWEPTRRGISTGSMSGGRLMRSRGVPQQPRGEIGEHLGRSSSDRQDP